jgi:hypothetical protein
VPAQAPTQQRAGNDDDADENGERAEQAPLPPRTPSSTWRFNQFVIPGHSNLGMR